MKIFEIFYLFSWTIDVIQGFQSEERTLWFPTTIRDMWFITKKRYFLSNESYASIIQVTIECEKLYLCNLFCIEPGGYFSMWQRIIADPFLDESHLGSDLKKCYTHQLRGNIIPDLPDQSFNFSLPEIPERTALNFKNGVHNGSFKYCFKSTVPSPYLHIDFGQEHLIRKVNIYSGSMFQNPIDKITVRIGRSIHNDDTSRYTEIGCITLNESFPEKYASFDFDLAYPGRYISFHGSNSPPDFAIGTVQVYTWPSHV